MQSEEEIKRNIIVDGWTKLEKGFSFAESRKNASFKNGMTMPTTTQGADETFHQRINSSTKLSPNLPARLSPKFATSPIHIKISEGKN